MVTTFLLKFENLFRNVSYGVLIIRVKVAIGVKSGPDLGVA